MKPFIKQFAVAALFISCVASAQAQIQISDAWVRATVPQQKATGAFMQLRADKEMLLVDVHSPVAGTVEIHQMDMVDNVMKMRQLNSLDLPAGQVTVLKPGSYHLMMLDLKAQVKEGDKIPLTLVFEGKDKKRETVVLNAIARPLTAVAAH